MRLRGIYSLLAVAAAVGAMLVLAGPAAASNLHCGQVLTSSTTLIGNLDCTGTDAPAIYIGADNVTFNLNGFSITGDEHWPVIVNYDVPDSAGPWSGTVIKNGTLNVVGSHAVGFATYGGFFDTVDVVNIVGDQGHESIGVLSVASGGLTVVDSSISGVDTAVGLGAEIGDVIRNNTIETCSTGGCSWGFGVFSGGLFIGPAGLTDVVITGNAFTSDAPQTGTAYFAGNDAGTIFNGNTVTALETGVFAPNYDGGLVISNNVFGGAAPADGLVEGIYLAGHDHGDVISGNFIRNSFDHAVYDHHSFNNTYIGNIATANGRATDDFTFRIDPDGYGPVTMVNNIARLGYSAGFYINAAYTDSVSGPPYSMFAGNSAIANGTDGSPGFYDGYSVGSTWTGNVAKYNAFDGFVFDAPWREIVTGNLSSMNGDDGFLIADATANAQPLAVTATRPRTTAATASRAGTTRAGASTRTGAPTPTRSPVAATAAAGRTATPTAISSRAAARAEAEHSTSPEAGRGDAARFVLATNVLRTPDRAQLPAGAPTSLSRKPAAPAAPGEARKEAPIAAAARR